MGKVTFWLSQRFRLLQSRITPTDQKVQEFVNQALAQARKEWDEQKAEAGHHVQLTDRQLECLDFLIRQTEAGTLVTTKSLASLAAEMYPQPRQLNKVERFFQQLAVNDLVTIQPNRTSPGSCYKLAISIQEARGILEQEQRRRQELRTQLRL